MVEAIGTFYKHVQKFDYSDEELDEIIRLADESHGEPFEFKTTRYRVVEKVYGSLGFTVVRGDRMVHLLKVLQPPSSLYECPPSKKKIKR